MSNCRRRCRLISCAAGRIRESPVPAVFIGTRFGRRWTIVAGLVLLTGILIVSNIGLAIAPMLFVRRGEPKMVDASGTAIE